MTTPHEIVRVIFVVEPALLGPHHDVRSHNHRAQLHYRSATSPGVMIQDDCREPVRVRSMQIDFSLFKSYQDETFLLLIDITAWTLLTKFRNTIRSELVGHLRVAERGVRLFVYQGHAAGCDVYHERDLHALSNSDYSFNSFEHRGVNEFEWLWWGGVAVSQ